MTARLESMFDGRVARIVLAAPRPNIVDRAMVDALDAIVTQLDARELNAVVLSAEGPHFSYGASIPEHLPDQIGDVLARFSNFLRRLVRIPAPTIAAVRGRCLGGGFELVLACDLIVAEQDAQFALPEIQLGVFPPAASALLPLRIGGAQAALLTLTGATWSGTEAHRRGLVARVAASGTLEAELQAWLESDFVSRSAAGLRYAAEAVRRPVVHALDAELPQIDRLYLDRLMRTPGADEGIRAFLEKRTPRW
ncbi:MAG TPA: enoyl-CoA hydratase/isomerase family protein [Thermoanaerobaculia bacterium]|nr:enoyl-CoA hydratase/isomerase family protein [Thermoanaerobaculia bacterium]